MDKATKNEADSNYVAVYVLDEMARVNSDFFVTTTFSARVAYG